MDETSKRIKANEELLEILKNRRKALAEENKGLENTAPYKYWSNREELWLLDADIERKEGEIEMDKEEQKAQKQAIDEAKHQFKNAVKEGKKLLKDNHILPGVKAEIEQIADLYYSGQLSDDYERGEKYNRLKHLIS